MLKHYSVLLEETVGGLMVKPDGIYVDGTTGGGGHSEMVAKQLTGGKLICIDRDDYARQKAAARLEPYKKNIIFVKDNFKNIGSIIDGLGIKGIDGFMLDLGVSSFQLDDGDRGFSYNYDAPLDMRMDKDDLKTAFDVVNTYSEWQLKKVISDYGEERFAGRIASNICTARAQAEIKTTFELAEIIKSSIPAAARREGPHPAKRTFQAIRIEVNDELMILKDTIKDAADRLNAGGRMAIISFHSLEDRIVKTTFNELATGCTCPRDFPICVCGKKPQLKVITKKPILPSEEELAENNRSRSAKLRIAEKCKVEGKA